jgi:hypothetical protein
MFLALLAACQPPAPSTLPTDQSVTAELVEAGCLAASDGGVAAVAAEHAGPNPLWLNCLYQPGGTVASCSVPCSR